MIDAQRIAEIRELAVDGYFYRDEGDTIIALCDYALAAMREALASVRGRVNQVRSAYARQSTQPEALPAAMGRLVETLAASGAGLEKTDDQS